MSRASRGRLPPQPRHSDLLLMWLFRQLRQLPADPFTAKGALTGGMAFLGLQLAGQQSCPSPSCTDPEGPGQFLPSPSRTSWAGGATNPKPALAPHHWSAAFRPLLGQRGIPGEEQERAARKRHRPSGWSLMVPGLLDPFCAGRDPKPPSSAKLSHGGQRL